MNRSSLVLVLTGALAAGASTANAQDATQAYREFLNGHRHLFNLIRDAERSKGTDLPYNLDPMEVAEACAGQRAELQPFVEACKAGKYATARESALPPERGCELAGRAGELLKDYLDRIATMKMKLAQGNASASLDELKKTGCAASFENFYAMAKPGGEQARTAKLIQDAYAKAGIAPGGAAAAGDFSKELEAAVTAAIAGSKPSTPAKKDPASEKVIVDEMNRLCKAGVRGQPARGCAAMKAWMTTDEWEIFKNPLGIPKRRTREAKVLLRLADRKHCLRQHVVVAQEYQGGKYAASKAEIGSGACPVECK